jgi:Ca2+:H+ antiporter
VLLVAGINHEWLIFKDNAINTMETTMIIATLSLIVPSTVSSNFFDSDQSEPNNQTDILVLSHGSAVFMLLLFLSYLYFQLTRGIFLDIPDTSHAMLLRRANSNRRSRSQHSVLMTLLSGALFITSIALTIWTAFYLIDSVDPFSRITGTNKAFISLIIIPFTGNLAKWIDVLQCSRASDIARPLRTVIGATVQIVLFALPALTILGWISGVHFALDFDIFESSILFLVAMVMNSVMQEGKATYFEGAMLMGS